MYFAMGLSERRLEERVMIHLRKLYKGIRM